MLFSQLGIWFHTIEFPGALVEVLKQGSGIAADVEKVARLLITLYGICDQPEGGIPGGGYADLAPDTVRGTGVPGR